MYPTNVIQLPVQAEQFYKTVLRLLVKSNANILVGGSIALAYYMHLSRSPKDMDIFTTRQDCEAALSILNKHGYRTEVLHSHWLAKVYMDDFFIDFIFNSGNGIAEVNDEWFANTHESRLFDTNVRLCSAEDIVWTKAFIMDRERYDGADIVHLIHDAGAHFDWARLLKRFAEHWRVLLSHLLLFQYIYPNRRNTVPSWVIEILLLRVLAEQGAPLKHADEKICRGTLLSRDQYLADIAINGYLDGRVEPTGRLSAEQVAEYTDTFVSMQSSRVATRNGIDRLVA